jgi:hypothetical protein
VHAPGQASRSARTYPRCGGGGSSATRSTNSTAACGACPCVCEFRSAQPPCRPSHVAASIATTLHAGAANAQDRQGPSLRSLSGPASTRTRARPALARMFVRRLQHYSGVAPCGHVFDNCGHTPLSFIAPTPARPPTWVRGERLWLRRRYGPAGVRGSFRSEGQIGIIDGISPYRCARLQGQHGPAPHTRSRPSWYAGTHGHVHSDGLADGRRRVRCGSRCLALIASLLQGSLDHSPVPTLAAVAPPGIAIEPDQRR